MKHILLICNTSHSVTTFRKGLISTLMEQGCKISAVAFDEGDAEQIQRMGVDFYCIHDKNRSTNPLKILSLKKKYEKLIETLKPDIVFTFMLKPNTFGVRAAHNQKVEQIYSMVEGAGDVFANDSLKWKIIRSAVCRLYKKSFQHVQKVFFLNEGDRAEFICRKLVKEKQAVIIPGIGVDLEKFTYQPLQNDRTFLMIARMLKTKGVMEYCECARIVKQKYPDAVFNYLGGEGTVTLADIQPYIDDGSINYLGVTKDVRPYLSECTAHILPTYYREGLVLVNVEAGAIGRLSITGNTIGAKDTVIDGYTGFLVPIKSAEALAEKVICLIEHPEMAEQMGKNSRQLAEDRFDQRLINQRIVHILLGQPVIEPFRSESVEKI